jgi:hypothetical protein
LVELAARQMLSVLRSGVQEPAELQLPEDLQLEGQDVDVDDGSGSGGGGSCSERERDQAPVIEEAGALCQHERCLHHVVTGCAYVTAFVRVVRFPNSCCTGRSCHLWLVASLARLRW